MRNSSRAGKRAKSRPECGPECGPDVLGHLGGSLHAQWRRHRKGLKRCQRHFSRGAVHDSRIETRRLMAILDLLGAFLPEKKLQPARRALKRQLDSFDPLRDTQVQVAYLKRMADTFPAARAYGKRLRGREAKFTRQTRRAIRHIQTKRLGRRIAGLEKGLCRRRKEMPPTRAFTDIRRVMGQSFAQVRKLAAAVRADDTETIHRTRIAFKRFRYMVEALAPLWPAIREEFCLAMRRHQTMMGDIQDMEVMLATLDKQTRKADNEAAGELRAELARRREHLIRAYLKAAGELRQFWPLPGEPDRKRKPSQT